MNDRLLVLWLVAIPWGSPLPAAAPVPVLQGAELEQQPVPSLVFSGELRGDLLGCEGCGDRPGIIEQAAWLEAIQGRDVAPLLVDGGNSLFGGDAQASGGAAAAATLEVLGYDVVHLSYRDLRLGLQVTRELVAERGFAALSANLLDAATDEPLFTPSVVREVAGRSVALLGLTEVPPALRYSKELQSQLEGVRIAPPATVLAEWAPKLAEQAEQVVLVYYGSARSLGRVLDAGGDHVDLVLLTGGRGGTGAGRVPVAAAEPGAGALTLATITDEGWSVTTRAGDVDARAQADAGATPTSEALAAVLGEYGLIREERTQVVVAPPVPRAPSGPPQGLEGVGVEPADINRAIDSGREALLRLVEEAGGWKPQAERRMALAAYAVLHALPADERDEFLDEVRPMVLGMRHCTDSYQLSVLLQLALKVGVPADEIERLVRRLVDGQRADGAWNYSSRAVTASSEDGGAMGLDASGQIQRRGAWGVPEGAADSSITQFALLALRAAERAGFDVTDDVWKRAAQHYVRSQSTGGGWGYRGSEPRGSMTCAGVASLTLCRHALGDEKPRAGADVQAGLGWLDQSFSVTEHPGVPLQHVLYYLYSLERVGVFMDSPFIGAHEWYPAGAKALLAMQMGDGTWIENRRDRIVGTSFALLFLCRATEALEVDRTEPGEVVIQVKERAPEPVYLILDASGSMLSRTSGGSTRFEELRAAVLAWITELSANRPVGIRVYGSRLRSIEDGAERDSELLVPLGEHDASRLAKVVGGLRARGKTPLTFSLDEARKDLKRMTPAPRVLLLSDGGDDTRARARTLGAAKALRSATGAMIDVVGFTAGRGEEQLRGIADAGGGRYLAAEDAREQILSTLSLAIPAGPPALHVLDAGGATAASPDPNTPFSLPPGEYVLRASADGQTISFTVHPGRTTRIPLDPQR